MLSNSETPRPLPPAKARKASANLKATSSTPPPAYGAPLFSFPARRDMNVRRDILGSPMDTTFRMLSWDAEHTRGPSGGDRPVSPPPDDIEWMSEKSREELQELLFKADGIIKERENELGLTSVFCKNLYENNVNLKSKHEALLARIPMSPARSISSPEHLSRRARGDSTSLTYSTSESALDLVNSPPYRHTRKVSIATADISLLADQNAELLDKLQTLEEEAISTDQAGRRELKKLEKEISFLREALEKTQAKSEALEEKVQDAVVGEAWRRKKEREAKFRSMRKLNREGKPETEVRNFAPDGSRFGGPTESFSLLHAAENPDRQQQLTNTSGSNMDTNVVSSLGPPEHGLISQLLLKVQELEEANIRILKQQSETASQLSAVQRDTMQITKVYECLADHDSVELELDGERTPKDEKQKTDKEKEDSSTQTIRFKSLKRNIVKDFDATRIVHPEFVPMSKNRKSVLGLFDAPNSRPAEDNSDYAHGQSSLSSWSEGYERSTWSSMVSEGVTSPLPRPLSPLHFFSPPSQSHPEVPLGPTLQNELDMKLGDGGWSMTGPPAHLRASSLYDLSQFSLPSSPSPLSRVTSDELNHESIQKASLAHAMNHHDPLRFSVDPPTPDSLSNVAANIASERGAPSPRMQLMSQTLRSRSTRWADRRVRRNRSHEAIDAEHERADTAAAPVLGIPQRLSNAVDNMIEDFRGMSTTRTDQHEEGDDHFEIKTDDEEDEDEDGVLVSPPRSPSYQDKALQLHGGATRKGELNSTSFVFQAWLWMQFAIVIFVFLFAMAKRGPAVVLSDESNRKAVARRK